MPDQRPTRLLRRTVLSGSLAFVAAGAKRPVITMLGDSLTAGLGLPAAQAIPAQLQAELKRLGVDAEVRAAGVSGDTSADGLARADFSVKPDTDLCLVALGGNDLLQGIEPKVLKANLDAILAKLKARHICAMLVGIAAPHAVGANYAREFDAVVPDLAKARGVPAYADLLGRVQTDPVLKQADGVHPTAAGVKIVVKALAPAVAKALNSPR